MRGYAIIWRKDSTNNLSPHSRYVIGCPERERATLDGVMQTLAPISTEYAVAYLAADRVNSAVVTRDYRGDAIVTRSMLLCDHAFW